MQPRTDIIRFAVLAVALSTMLGWLFWSAGGSVGSYTLDVSMLAVPVTAVMLASVGFAWKRKLVYASTTLGVYVLSGVLAGASGVLDAVRTQMSGGGAFPSVGAILYMVWLTTFPFAMLLLFVGRRPSLLWGRRDD